MNLLEPPATVCEDISLFKKILKDLRSIDDNVVPRLNAVLTRAASPTEACVTFAQQLEQSYESRNRFIGSCVQQNQARAAKAKLAVEESDSPEAKMEYLKQQGKVRAMEAELEVERILRQRTSEVYRARCWSTPIKQELWEFQS
ncbi:caffeine-induced death protein 2 [Phlyctochytrium arcticum]|nr:caffeine-induced death protein 2 [Phlyctochytrium arcticum]